MRLVVVEFMTLDGVMEAPGYEEHRTGRNAWAMRTSDADLQEFNRQQAVGADAYLFGRTTFHIWEAYWPTAPASTAAFAESINARPKYVVSRTLKDSDWKNTIILRGDLEGEIRALKNKPGGDVVVYGSAQLVQQLLELDLVDELRILLFPVLLGSGKRLFADEVPTHNLRLLSSQAFSSGVVKLIYDGLGAPTPRPESQALDWTAEQRDAYRALEDVGRVLATILFTDVVDSTVRAASLGDREWRRLLDRHDEASEAEVRRWHGEVVKRTGDGVMARFDTPTRALRCALALVDVMNRIGLPIRAALHTGEVEVRGADLGGIAVHIASRAVAVAGMGEVVVTRTVRELAAGSDLAFRPLGSVALRGVPQEWELFGATRRND